VDVEWKYTKIVMFVKNPLSLFATNAIEILIKKSILIVLLKKYLFQLSEYFCQFYKKLRKKKHFAIFAMLPNL